MKIHIIDCFGDFRNWYLNGYGKAAFFVIYYIGIIYVMGDAVAGAPSVFLGGLEQWLLYLLGE